MGTLLKNLLLCLFYGEKLQEDISKKYTKHSHEYENN